MAFTKIDALESPIADLPDRVTGQAAWLKSYFDADPEQLRVAINALIDELKAGTAADQIGYAQELGITADTVQGAIAVLKGMLDEATTGTIPDGSLTTEKLADGAVTGAKISAGAITSDKLPTSVVNGAAGSHNHGNMTAQGAIGASSGRVIVTGESGVLQAVTAGTAHNKSFGTSTPAAPSDTASAGVSNAVARADHVHPIGAELKNYIAAQIAAITDYENQTF